jgi:hypothetical protein
MPAAALASAPAAPPEPLNEGVLPVPGLPLELGLGRVRGPLELDVGGATTVPEEFTKIAGFKPLTKPENDFADLIGPVSPKLLRKNLPCAADALGS